MPTSTAAGKRRKRKTRPAGRAIHGTVFTAQEVLRVSNREVLNRLANLHAGIGARGQPLQPQSRRHVIFPVPNESVRRHRGPIARRREHLYVPLRLPSNTPRGIHHRSDYTGLIYLGKIGNKHVFSKGLGIRDAQENTESKRKINGVRVPFFWRRGAEYNTQRLRGGARRSFQERSMDMAEALREQFQEMLAKGDETLAVLTRMGINEAPTLDPIVLTKPLQMPIEYTERDHYRMETMPFIPIEPKLVKEKERRRREAFRKRLTKRERTVFDFLYSGEVERGGRERNVKMKVSKIGRHTNIPRRIQRQQVVFSYAVRSAFRLSETGAPLASIKAEAFSPNSPLYPKSREVKAYHDLFSQHGFVLTAVKNKHRQYRLKVTRKRRRAEISMEKATKEIIKQFAAKLGLNLYLMHEGLGGTFTQISKKRGKDDAVISSLSDLNITMAGEVVDLDTAMLGRESGKKLQEEQKEDIGFAEKAIEKLVDMLAENEEHRKRLHWAGTQILYAVRKGMIR